MWIIPNLPTFHFQPTRSGEFHRRRWEANESLRLALRRSRREGVCEMKLGWGFGQGIFSANTWPPSFTFTWSLSACRDRHSNIHRIIHVLRFPELEPEAVKRRVCAGLAPTLSDLTLIPRLAESSISLPRCHVPPGNIHPQL